MDMESFKKTLWEYIQVVLISVITSFVILYFVQISRVVGESMKPTYHEGDVVLVDKIFYKQSEPKYNDIVVVKYGNEQIIKRVIGVEGDKIELISNELYINGQRIEEDYINEKMEYNDFSYEVPKGKIFIMGDNRNHSKDSRDPSLGQVPYDAILGKSQIRIFPFSKIGLTK